MFNGITLSWQQTDCPIDEAQGYWFLRSARSSFTEVKIARWADSFSFFHTHATGWTLALFRIRDPVDDVQGDVDNCQDE
jgi:hypothetical protein